MVTMSFKMMPNQPKAATHPARPTGAKIDIRASHKRISKRYPKVLAKLAE